jgi:outer membrane protein
MRHTFLFLIFGVATVPIAFADSINIQPIPDLPLRSVPSAGEATPPVSGWRVSMGAGISFAPRYEGAANNRLRLVPLLEATDGHFFFGTLRGAGYNFSENRNLEYGVLLAPGHARWQNSDPRLNGMGDIRYSIEPGVFFNVRSAPWYFSSGFYTGIHGTHAEMGGGIFFLLSPADRIRFGVNLDWGNAQYNQTYFGVTPGQAVASGNALTPYSADAGIKDYALTSNWAHSFSKHWFSTAGVSYKWLAGSVQYSPLVESRIMRSLNFLVGYRFQ